MQFGWHAGHEMPVVKAWLPAGALTQIPAFRSAASGASVSVGTGLSCAWSSTGARLTAVILYFAWLSPTHFSAPASVLASAVLQWQHSSPRTTASRSLYA